MIAMINYLHSRHVDSSRLYVKNPVENVFTAESVQREYEILTYYSREGKDGDIGTFGKCS